MKRIIENGSYQQVRSMKIVQWPIDKKLKVNHVKNEYALRLSRIGWQPQCTSVDSWTGANALQRVRNA